MIFNLGRQISTIATDSVGLSGADLDAMNASVANNTAGVPTGGTAIDQIQVAAGVTPDIINQPWIINIYSTVSDFAMILFYIFFIAGLCAMILKHFNALPVSVGADAMHLLKKTIVAAFMIANGIPFVMLIMLLNQWMSEIFGGSVSVIALLVRGVISPLGPAIVVISCFAVVWNACFYLCRLAIIYLFVAAWPIAWILWMFDKTAHMGVKMLIIGTVNIFLGAGMCFLYWIGAQFILYGGSSLLTFWGSQIIGLIFMYLAYRLPKAAYRMFISRPPSVVNVAVNIAAQAAKL